MRKKSPTLVCRLSTPLTTKALEHVVLAYNLLRGRADRAKVAEAAQETAEEEAPHAALPAQAGQAALSDVRAFGGKAGYYADVLQCPLLTQNRHRRSVFVVKHNALMCADLFGCWLPGSTNEPALSVSGGLITWAILALAPNSRGRSDTRPGLALQ